jgi:hypothetical protein
MIDQAARGKKISISSSARLVVGIVAASGLLEGLDDIGSATWRRNGRFVFTRSAGIRMAIFIAIVKRDGDVRYTPWFPDFPLLRGSGADGRACNCESERGALASYRTAAGG